MLRSCGSLIRWDGFARTGDACEANVALGCRSAGFRQSNVILTIPAPDCNETGRLKCRIRNIRACRHRSGRDLCTSPSQRMPQNPSALPRRHRVLVAAWTFDAGRILTGSSRTGSHWDRACKFDRRGTPPHDWRIANPLNMEGVLLLIWRE